MSLDTSKIVKKITYNGVEFVQAGSSNVVNDLISGTITEVTSDTLGGVESIRNNAFSGMEIETVSVPSNVTSVGDSAFANNNITTLTIDEGVQTIGNNAFQNNSIEMLTIPSSVTSIGDGAFSGNNLTEITMESDTPPIVTSTTFPSTLQTTNVSYNGYETYSTDPNWTTYKNTLVRGLAIPSTITVTVDNYLGELVNGASVTISGNGQTYMGTTNESGVFTQGDLQPATYTISVADLEGFKTPDTQEVVVEQDTQNSVTVTYLEKSTNSVDPVFGNNSPEVISAVGDEIATKGYTSSQVAEIYGWNIGDTVSYTLSTGEPVEMRIIGFNHDDLADGSGKAGITLEMTHCLATSDDINDTATTEGGYPASVLRNSTIPSIKATIPQEWQNVIKLVNKKSSNNTEVTTSVEDLFILSQIEISNTITNTKHGEGEGIVYEYWNGKGDIYRIKNQDTNGDGVLDSQVIWWLRSIRSGYTGRFVTIVADGTLGMSTCSGYPRGISYAFCVGAPKKFGDYTPSEISAISAEISANNMTSEQVKATYGWNIGDTISYQLTTGEPVEMRIIGFNHDDKSDGSGKAGITLEMKNCLATLYKMNSNKNNGGYPASLMHSTYLPTIKSTIPQEWQDVIKYVDKKSANGSGTAYKQTITTSEDLFLLSEYETYGTSTTAQNGDTEGAWYEYYITNNTKNAHKKWRDSDGDGVVNQAVGWWLRSCSLYSDNAYCHMDSGGGIGANSVSSEYGVSYAFCI